MLAGQSQDKGVKYCVQLLFNGWVFASILWYLGSLVEFLISEFNLEDPYDFSFWLEIAGWFVCGLFVVIFFVRLGIYWHARKSGKYL